MTTQFRRRAIVLRPPWPRADDPPELVVCSHCLAVQRGSTWISAEAVIHELRSYEQAAPPRMTAPALCDDCRAALASRREAAAHAAAA